MNLESLELKSVSLKMEGVTVLDSIDLEITPGSSTVIFGRSGSGKTTLLKSLAGLIRIDDGEVLFNDRNVGKMDEDEFFHMQSQSGFVFQDAALWANKTIYDNLAIPLRILNPKMDKADIDNRISAAVEMLGFRDNLMIRPSAVSAGEKKIISFLRALMTDPEILFLDEPTSSLDKKNISRLNSIIRELNKENKTIITVTHDFSLARSIADDIIILDEGKIVKKGKFQDILGSDERDIEDIIEEIKGQV